jgi:hypothetical protein
MKTMAEGITEIAVHWSEILGCDIEPIEEYLHAVIDPLLVLPGVKLPDDVEECRRLLQDAMERLIIEVTPLKSEIIGTKFDE